MILLMYSDLHLRPERLDTCKFVLDWVKQRAVELSKTNKVLIVNGGDSFNTRGVIPTSCLDVASKCFMEWHEAGLKQVIIVGNHDQEDRGGLVHPMKVFEKFGWIVVDRPKVLNGIAFFPYLKIDEIEKFLKSNKLKQCRTAVVHWGIRGAKRNDTNTDTDGVPLEWLSNFDRVFSGHYHYRNAIGNVQYIGSPFQQNFGEMDQEKGVLLFDTDSGKTWFEEIVGTPKHYEIEVTWDKNGKRVIKGEKNHTDKDFVRVKVIGDSEHALSFKKEDLKLNAATLKLEREVEEKFTSRLKIEDRHNISGLMQKYVDFVGFSGDRKKLLDIGREFCDSAH